jgi:hypothetical protein
VLSDLVTEHEIVRAGMVASVRDYRDRDDALEAAGLSE